MHYGNGLSRVYRLERRNKALADSWRCCICPPHRGENTNRGKNGHSPRHGKWIYSTHSTRFNNFAGGEFRPSKPKSKK